MSAPPGGPLRAAIEAAQAPLDVRLRGPDLARLTARFAPHCDVASGTALTLAILGATAGVLAAIEAAHDQTQARFDALAEALDGQGPAASRALLRAYLLETEPPGRARRADLAALRRALDVDAIRERVAVRTAHLAAELEFALNVLTAGLAPVATGAISPPACARVDLAPLVAQICDLVRRHTRWRVQRAALAAIGALCRALTALNRRHEFDPELVLETADACLDDGISPWVQAEALAATVAAERSTGLERCRNRITGARPHADDFIVRRLLVERAVADPERGEWSLFYAAADDPSPAVRQAACHAARISEGEPRLALIAHLAGLGTRPEPDPKVRGYALLELSCALAAGASDDETARGVRLFEEVLKSEAHPLPRDLAVRGLAAIFAALADRGALDPQGARARSVCWTLDGLRANAALSAAEHEQCSATLEIIWAALCPERWAALRALLAEAGRIPSGGRRWLRFADAPPGLARICQAGELGRLLAIASRDDMDLTARITRRGIRLTRGDLRVRRPWRILHEVRNPSPAKRKSFLHTIGRASADPLRAPTRLMDEVTRTEVPGERLHVVGEGSWGRHLPRNEDLLDVCGWRARAAEIYSAHGTTAIAAPRSAFGRLTLWWRMTRRFAELANLRNVALAADEPHVRGRYVAALRALGARVEFRPHPRPTGETGALSAHVRALFSAPEEPAT